MMKCRLIIDALLLGMLLTACSKSPAPESKAAPKAGEPVPFNMASVFPEGPGREKVMNACGSCHPVVCVAKGQRTAERWESIKAGHRDKLADTSSADLDGMFTYLTANFNDKKPEPQIPAELAQQGCTPF